MTTVHEVTSRTQLRSFINYPYQKYKGHPHWIPPLRISEWERYNPKKNPFYEHGRLSLFLAKRNGKVIGRIAAIDDDIHNQTHEDNLAFFGFFEADDLDTAKVLFAKVEDWARAHGRQALRGPTNPTMNDGAGFQVDGFDTAPFIMMPYTPPEYPQFAEAAGYQKVKDLYAWLFETEEGMTEKLQRMAERVAKRHAFSIRPLNKKRFEEDVSDILNFYNETWEKNWGQTKYTDKEAKHLASELKMIADPDLALMLEIEGDLAGVAVSFPDANQLFKKMKGRLLPFGIFHLLNAKRIINQARLPILGVKAAHRNKGLELVLINEMFKRGRAKYKRCECSWILEDNESMNRGIALSGAKLYKTYRLFQKNL